MYVVVLSVLFFILVVALFEMLIFLWPFLILSRDGKKFRQLFCRFYARDSDRSFSRCVWWIEKFLRAVLIWSCIFRLYHLVLSRSCLRRIHAKSERTIYVVQRRNMILLKVKSVFIPNRIYVILLLGTDLIPIIFVSD